MTLDHVGTSSEALRARPCICLPTEGLFLGTWETWPLDIAIYSGLKGFPVHGFMGHFAILKKQASKYDPL